MTNGLENSPTGSKNLNHEVLATTLVIASTGAMLPVGHEAPAAIAVDAGPMQIQLWEGAVLRCAGTVPQRATHDTMCQEAGNHKKA